MHAGQRIPVEIGRQPRSFEEDQLHAGRVGIPSQNWKGCFRGPLIESGAMGWCEIKVLETVAKDVRPAVLLALFDLVQLFTLLLIPHPIHAIVPPIQVLGAGLEVESNRVAKPGGKGLSTATVQVVTLHRTVDVIPFLAGIAGTPDRDV